MTRQRSVVHLAHLLSGLRPLGGPHLRRGWPQGRDQRVTSRPQHHPSYRIRHWPISPKLDKSQNASPCIRIVSRRLVSFSADPRRNRTLLSSRRPDVLNSLRRPPVDPVAPTKSTVTTASGSDMLLVRQAGINMFPTRLSKIGDPLRTTRCCNPPRHVAACRLGYALPSASGQPWTSGLMVCSQIWLTVIVMPLSP